MPKKLSLTLDNNRRMGRRALSVKSREQLQETAEFAFYYDAIITPDGDELIYCVFMKTVSDEQKSQLVTGGMRYTGRFRCKGQVFHEFVLPFTELEAKK